MSKEPQRTPPVEVGVAIPIGCMVPLAIATAVLAGGGVLMAHRVIVRGIDDGAVGGPKVISTQVVSLR